jgi:hypothetical protein
MSTLTARTAGTCSSLWAQEPHLTWHQCLCPSHRTPESTSPVAFLIYHQRYDYGDADFWDGTNTLVYVGSWYLDWKYMQLLLKPFCVKCKNCTFFFFRFNVSSKWQRMPSKILLCWQLQTCSIWGSHGCSAVCCGSTSPSSVNLCCSTALQHVS